MAKISPFNATSRDLSSTALIVGSEGTGKHDIAKSLVDMGTAIGLNVHTCCTLPLLEESPVGRMNIAFICFVMDIAKKDSFTNLLHSISKVDISYFLGRSAIIVNTSCHSTEESMPFSQILDVRTQYGIPALFRNMKNSEELNELGRSLLGMIKTALGHVTNVTPLLYDSLQMDQTATCSPFFDT